MEAEANVDEDTGGDAAGVPGKQHDSSSKDTTTLSMERGHCAPQTPQIKDEVRQCLEQVLVACVAAAGANGDNRDETGLGFGVKAENKATITSEIGMGERAEDAKEQKKASFRCDARCQAVLSTLGSFPVTAV